MHTDHLYGELEEMSQVSLSVTLVLLLAMAVVDGNVGEG